MNTHQDFESFDRYSFIKYHLNKITTLWVQLRIASGLWEDEGKYAINYDAFTFFETNSFNIDAFRTATNRTPNDQQIALGKMLFFEPRLSESENLACVSCHDPSKAYADGFTLGQDKNGNELKRNTPTLINSVFQRAFFWDGRSDNLEAQITNVFTNENEFNAAVHQISTDILTDSIYASQFEAAFGAVRRDNIDIIKAISSYVSTLNSFNSKFDRDIRSDEKLLTDQEIKGMNLFMGKALCSTCHFAPLFNGTVPPNFKEHEKEALGSPDKSDNKSLDDDLGFYSVYEADLHKNMFKTPTVRIVEFTAPYMHNGVYNTLEEVMDFYNRGGGNGLGFSLENQTLPFDSLQLKNDEQKAIIAFMKTLSDTTITGY